MILLINQEVSHYMYKFYPRELQNYLQSYQYFRSKSQYLQTLHNISVQKQLFCIAGNPVAGVGQRALDLVLHNRNLKFGISQKGRFHWGNHGTCLVLHYVWMKIFSTFSCQWFKPQTTSSQRSLKVKCPISSPITLCAVVKIQEQEFPDKETNLILVDFIVYHFVI